MELAGAASLCSRWNFSIFDGAATPCRRACRASSGRCRRRADLHCTYGKSAWHRDCPDSGLRHPANAGTLHIRAVFCARIQGNQGAPCVHRARTRLKELENWLEYWNKRNHKIERGGSFTEPPLLRYVPFCPKLMLFLSYTRPWPIIASATFSKPAMLAPFTRSYLP